MKKIIKQIDHEHGIFACMEKKNLKYYYLTRSNIKKFIDYLDVGVLVSFKRTNKTKRINRKKCYHVETIYKIEKPTSRTVKTLYSLADVRKQIFNVLTSFDYYLFTDFEMSMPPYYRVKNFKPEIIQFGYVLTDNKLNIIKDDGYYIKTTYYKNISKRTLNFLKITQKQYSNSTPYINFYNDLESILKKYDPKIVVWGKNDYLTLDRSYSINKVKPLTNRDNFINLLQVIKTYYNLYDDLGLARGYKRLVNKTYEQKHHALHDAHITKEIFEAFKKEMIVYKKKTFRPLKA